MYPPPPPPPPPLTVEGLAASPPSPPTDLALAIAYIVLTAVLIILVLILLWKRHYARPTPALQVVDERGVCCDSVTDVCFGRFVLMLACARGSEKPDDDAQVWFSTSSSFLSRWLFGGC
ncbi:hypothetical protein Tsubulata_014529 [Turnera subulata]|uniref:Uncharacterized protein n=1 Tax=Turnera subulata TaxID=218843 RepID=A0A9Q0FFI3_9ROSI|nr:hypothetical protein Tsubulata_014529 [Turnera subulata]